MDHVVRLRVWIGCAFLILGGQGELWGQAPFKLEVAPAITEKWRWHHLEALDREVAYCGAADEAGTLWLGVMEGLVSYDGIEVRRHPYPDSINPAVPNQVLVVGAGEVLCRTVDGVRVLRDGKWRNLLSSPIGTGDRQNCFARIDTRRVIVATWDGVYVYVSGQDELRRLTESPAQNALVDRRGRLWVTASEGDLVRRIQLRDGDLAEEESWQSFDLGMARGDSRVLSREMANGDIWFLGANRQQQPMLLDAETGNWESQEPGFNDAVNPIVDVVETVDGSILVQTTRSLMVKHDAGWTTLEFPEFAVPVDRPFLIDQGDGRVVVGGHREAFYQIDCSDREFLTWPGLNFQIEDLSGHLWFISHAGEVLEWDPTGRIWHQHQASLPEVVTALLISTDGTVWAAGAHQGEAAVAYRQGAHWHLDTFPQLGRMIGYQSAFEDSMGRIYFGEGSQGGLQVDATGGLVEYRPNSTGGFDHHLQVPPAVPRRIVGIAEADGALWFGGLSLARLAPTEQSVVEFLPGFRDRWTDDVIGTVGGDLWVAQWGLGVQRWRNGEWTFFTARDGLASNQVTCLLEGQTTPGEIWAATQNGISRFDGESWTSLSLDRSLRLNRESGSLKQTRDGAIWINQASRAWFFRASASGSNSNRNPEQFRVIRYRPDRVAPSGRIVDFEAKAEAPANLYFRFVGLDPWAHTPAAKLEYSYRLDDEPWSAYSTKAEVLLLGTPVGRHQLQMRVRDLDGNTLSEPASVEFVVIPPLWKRPWFLAALSVTLGCIFGLIGYIIRQRVRHLMAMEEFKLQFFTNLSHELRTPLTAILGPLESLMARMAGPDERGFLDLARRNAEKLRRVVDQLLDFRRAAERPDQMDLGYGELVGFVREEVALDRGMADRKNQTLTFRSNVDSHHGWFDAGKLEKIVDNLVSNAIKYTGERGSIRVALSISPSGGMAELEVLDDGRGIPAKSQKEIFDPFFRVAARGAETTAGTGLGLALTRQLVENWGGQLQVQSPPVNSPLGPVGTRFLVRLPISQKGVVPLPEPASSSAPIVSVAEPELREDGEGKNTILIAEDDADIREFLAMELKTDYRVIVAADGLAAWEAALQESPSVIITDVMMPRLNGRELCAQLKASEVTSHIPVVMLSALKSDSHEMSGLATGADDYIPKPVRLDYLRSKLHNLLATRRRWQEAFQRQLVGEPFDASQTSANPVDQKFLQRALKFVEENIDSETLDVEVMAQKLGMSRVTLYRKIKALSGMPPSGFIRAVRLKHAAELLRTGQFQVQEVVGRVGFQESSYFGACFKKQFGRTPGEYMAQFSRDA